MWASTEQGSDLHLFQTCVVGEAQSFSETCALADQVAGRRSTVMLLGETGTGKEVLARRIHAQSARASAPFIPVDCSSITSTLFESELFGHVSGAFTGASRDSLGFIRAAHGGTLFLDEIGELPLSMQAKLLRVLQERRVTPVGDTKSHPLDIRVICATHRDLQKMVREETFRQDLFFRLNIMSINVPPLRHRAEDILPLAKHFLNMQAEIYDEPIKALDDDAEQRLMAHTWPGNVRELANAMEHAHVLCAGTLISAAHLPSTFREVAQSGCANPRVRPLAEVQRKAIADALKEADYNKAAASRYLGINVQRLTRLIEKLDVPCC